MDRDAVQQMEALHALVLKMILASLRDQSEEKNVNLHHLQISSSVLAKPLPVGVGSLISLDSAQEANSMKQQSATLPQGIVTNVSYDVSYADEIGQSNSAHSSSPPVSEHFVKAGMAAVGLLSDLVNYRIPLTDRSAMTTKPAISVVDRVKPISSMVSTNVKTKTKMYRKSSCKTEAGVDFTDAGSGEKDKVDKPKAVKNVSNGSHHLHETRGIISDQPHEKKSSVPRPSAYSNRASQNPQQSNRKFSSNMVEGFTQPMRAMRVIAGRVPMTRQYLNSNHNVETVSRILQQFKWGPAAEEALGNLNCLLDAYQANQVLKQLKDYPVALGFFYWLKRQPGFKHDGHTYTTMVGILGRSRQFSAINKLFDQMIHDGCQPNIVTYNRLIHSYGRANYLSDAVCVFNQMQKVGCQPDRVTYCTLIDIHAKSGYLDVAMDMYERMQEAGLSPDTFTYSVIINCLGKAGHLSAAHKLFCEMVNQGCVPNLITYNIMIALHAKARNYQSALQLYRDMQSAGFEPDKVTYSIIIEVLGHSGYLDEAEAVFF